MNPTEMPMDQQMELNIDRSRVKKKVSYYMQQVKERKDAMKKKKVKLPSLTKLEIRAQELMKQFGLKAK